MGHSMARDNEEDKPSLDEMITARTELTQWSTIKLGSVEASSSKKMEVHSRLAIFSFMQSPLRARMFNVSF